MGVVLYLYCSRLHNRLDGFNRFCLLVEEYEGLNKTEALQQRENENIFQLSLNIIDKYFS